MLAHQITTRLHERDAAAPSNFAATLKELDSDQAQELTKDPYALQFLAVDGDVSEREHVEQLRYVVIELKTTTFDPRDTGQLGFYVAVVDDRLRIPDKHQATVGILLVAGKNDTVVRYALASAKQPVAVRRYELTDEMQKALPDETAIARAFADELDRSPRDTP
ncbi:PDDEXK nuclease domain-containing protein [Microbacterium sp. lyk4-40-TSB-66]|uniref:PDDEXK nuclease domain-containing protein n=1 Tax=Microbacterium sp. lyk4-40-TSB-66 TaxID=3040294 RepID=UPI003306736F